MHCYELNLIYALEKYWLASSFRYDFEYCTITAVANACFDRMIILKHGINGEGL